MNTNAECSDDSLRMLLQEDEDSHDYLSAAEHVDKCLKCQARLGELAASDNQWDEAHEMLVASRSELTDEARLPQKPPWQNAQRRPTA